MIRLKGRVTKLENKVHDHRKMPITVKLIYLGDENWPEHETLVKEKYLAENGTLDGLMIVKTWMPRPLPLPAAFRTPGRDDNNRT